MFPLLERLAASAAAPQAEGQEAMCLTGRLAAGTLIGALFGVVGIVILPTSPRPLLWALGQVRGEAARVLRQIFGSALGVIATAYPDGVQPWRAGAVCLATSASVLLYSLVVPYVFWDGIWCAAIAATIADRVLFLTQRASFGAGIASFVAALKTPAEAPLPVAQAV